MAANMTDNMIADQPQKAPGEASSGFKEDVFAFLLSLSAKKFNKFDCSSPTTQPAPTE